MLSREITLVRNTWRNLTSDIAKLGVLESVAKSRSYHAGITDSEALLFLWEIASSRCAEHLRFEAFICSADPATRVRCTESPELIKAGMRVARKWLKCYLGEREAKIAQKARVAVETALKNFLFECCDQGILDESRTWEISSEMRELRRPLMRCCVELGFFWADAVDWPSQYWPNHGGVILPEMAIADLVVIETLAECAKTSIAAYRRSDKTSLLKRDERVDSQRLVEDCSYRFEILQWLIMSRDRRGLYAYEAQPIDEIAAEVFQLILWIEKLTFCRKARAIRARTQACRSKKQAVL